MIVPTLRMTFHHFKGMQMNINGRNNPNYKTGYCCQSKKSSLYNSWAAMKGRCLNKNNPKYYRYGGRGIKIYKAWLSFEYFLEWAKNNGWKEGYSIDRIDNDGDYCPENCRWVSIYENSRNKSTTKLNKNIAEEIRKRKNENWYSLAKEYGCSHGNIWWIIHNFTHVADGLCTKKLKNKGEL